jgi:hypothetical protein
VAPGAQDVLAQPDGGVLLVRPAAALPVPVRRDLLGDQKTLDIIVPGILGLSVMSTTFNALAMNITFLREEGVLKRIHGTPLPPISYLGA